MRTGEKTARIIAPMPRGRSRGMGLRLPCIGDIAVHLADARDEQQLDEVERRAGGDLRDCRRSSASPASTVRSMRGVGSGLGIAACARYVSGRHRFAVGDERGLG